MWGQVGLFTGLFTAEREPRDEPVQCPQRGHDLADSQSPISVYNWCELEPMASISANVSGQVSANLNWSNKLKKAVSTTAQGRARASGRCDLATPQGTVLSVATPRWPSCYPYSSCLSWSPGDRVVIPPPHWSWLCCQHTPCLCSPPPTATFTALTPSQTILVRGMGFCENFLTGFPTSALRLFSSQCTGMALKQSWIASFSA